MKRKSEITIETHNSKSRKYNNTKDTQCNAFKLEERASLKITRVKNSVIKIEQMKPNFPISTRSLESWNRFSKCIQSQYFEIKIEKFVHSCFVAIGIANRQLKYDRIPGWDENSFAYHSDDGFFVAKNVAAIPFHSCHQGDIIGCGLFENELFFTKNGKLEIVFQLPESNEIFYPCIGIYHYSTILVKYAPPYKYNLNNFLLDKQNYVPPTDDITFYLKEHAMQGCAECSFQLGEMYNDPSAYGKNEIKDEEKAFQLIKFAAERGHDRAQFRLATIYENRGEHDLAYAYYALSHRNGCIDATVRLGYICYTNLEFEEALELLNKGIENEHPMAFCCLAYMYRDGYGIEKNPKKSIELFEKAVSFGSLLAKHYLGIMYSEGEGTEINYEKALNYFQAAANEGLEDSQYLLAKMYQQGKGTKKDLLQAIHWMTKAANLNLEQAKNELPNLYKQYKNENETKIQSLIFANYKKGKFVDVRFRI